MITKKLGDEIFAWEPTAFGGKGYWFVLGLKGGLGRAASKKEAGRLGIVKSESTLPKGDSESKPEVGEELQQNMEATKNKFSPSKIAKSLSSGFSKLMGRKNSDTAVSSEVKSKKDMLSTPASLAGSIGGDNLTSALTKLYELIKNNLEKEKKEEEVKKNFDKEKRLEEIKKHEEIIEAILEREKVPKIKVKKVAEKREAKPKAKAEKAEKPAAQKPAPKKAEKIPESKPAKPSTQKAPTKQTPAPKPPSAAKPSVSTGEKVALGVAGATAVAGAGLVGFEFAKNMVKRHEGVRNAPYKDSLGLWTVGVGHLIGDGKSLPPEWNRTLSNEEVDNLFDQDFEHHKKAAEKIPGYENLNDKGKSALIDLTFNMGPVWYKKWPTFTKQLQSNDIEGAAKNLEGSIWYKQVGKRGPEIVALIRGGGKGDTASATEPTNKTGTQLAESSSANKDLKIQQSGNTVIVNNSKNINVKEGNKQTNITNKTNDSPVFVQAMT